jgi:regulatory protein
MESNQAIRQEAVTLLSRREYSARELQQKLEATHPVDSVAGVIESLQSQGLQSDERFAQVWVRHRLLQGYGPLRIQAELRQKGVAGELVQQCLQDDSIDWFEQARQAHQRKFGQRPGREPREKARQMRFLQYRGFSGDQIRHAMQGAC